MFNNTMVGEDTKEVSGSRRDDRLLAHSKQNTDVIEVVLLFGQEDRTGGKEEKINHPLEAISRLVHVVEM
jgi:hypothetical protein